MAEEGEVLSGHANSWGGAFFSLSMSAAAKRNRLPGEAACFGFRFRQPWGPGGLLTPLGFAGVGGGAGCGAWYGAGVP